MKKSILLPLFTFANALFFSLGMECLLSLLGIVMAVSLDGSSVLEQYPRFVPFCLVLGIACLAGLIAVLILNLKLSEKLALTKTSWVLQYVLAFVAALPAVKLWEMLFVFLQKTF